MTAAPLRVGVIGLGLIGSSAARGLAREAEVIGFDPDPGTRELARAAGLDVAGSRTDTYDADLLLLAAPTGVNADLLARLIADGVRRPTADLGSVKQPIERAWLEADPSFPFVGTHPMAGSHTAGFAAGSAELFADAPWPVAIHRDTDPAALLVVLQTVLRLSGRPIPVTAAGHDLAVAAISHLPHLLSGALGGVVANDPDLAVSLAGGSFRDASRVSGSPPARSAEFLTANAAAAASRCRAAAAGLLAAAQLLERADEAGLAAWLTSAHDVRARFDHRWDARERRSGTGPARQLLETLLAVADSGTWVASLDGDPRATRWDLAAAGGWSNGVGND